jgi:ribonuclease D
VLPDAAIVAAAEMDPRDERGLLVLPGFGGRSVRRLASVWLDALARARELPDDALPTNPPTDGPPPPHRWAERDPVAAARLARCRAQVTTIAVAHTLPPENLISPDAVRRLAWIPPVPLQASAVDAALASAGVRRWQRELTVDALTAALAER